MKSIRLILSLTISVGLFYGLNTKFGKIPPLGKFFNPFGGFWQNAEPKNAFQSNQSIALPKVKEKIEIVFDDRLVPHIFAQNEEDLYFAQGFVTAKLRLWQMDFQTRAAAGRIAEILGPGENNQYINFDKFQRRMGMVYAAERSRDTIMRDETTRKVVEAYTRGVNAYLQSINEAEYPIEFKLLDYEPEEWTPLKSALLLKYMAYDLSASSDDVEMTNILKTYKGNITEELFPNFTRKQEPIVPLSTRVDFRSLVLPKVPTANSVVKKEDKGKDLKLDEKKTNPNKKEQKKKDEKVEEQKIEGQEEEKPKEEEKLKEEEKTNPEKKEAEEKDEIRKGIGSNNWAISAAKSASGYPILANDPHLSLNLPSIWFEIQLITPQLNVYGVSLPGAPCVIIGFNKDVSWGVTNVESDVLDWYKIKFKDNSLAEYWHDEKWFKTKQRIEKIRVRGGRVLSDTIVLTKHGPVVVKPHEQPFTVGKTKTPPGHAMRWIAHEYSNELLTFIRLNKAKNFGDYKKALATYFCPAQNFVYADVNKEIAITSNGRFPVKYRGQGKFILDGSNPLHDWYGWVPPIHNPGMRNPARGYVSSANQFPADTVTYPYYLHWEFASFDRAARINEVLDKMEKATPDDFLKLQNDNMNMTARVALPTMLNYVRKGNREKYAKAYENLKNWNYMHDIDKTAPTIFKLWWSILVREIWTDELGEKDMRFPPKDVTVSMVEDTDSTNTRWFDNIKTEAKENAADIINRAFVKSIDSLQRLYGEEIGKKWAWGTTKKTSIKHLADIAPFSVSGLVTAGDADIVNATGKRNGPSWKMVVALGKNVQAFGVYPGGQSGNPGSYFYLSMVEKWRKGELYELFYMKKANEKSNKILSVLTLTK